MLVDLVAVRRMANSIQVACPVRCHRIDYRRNVVDDLQAIVRRYRRLYRRLRHLRAVVRNVYDGVGENQRLLYSKLIVYRIDEVILHRPIQRFLSPRLPAFAFPPSFIPRSLLYDTIDQLLLVASLLAMFPRASVARVDTCQLQQRFPGSHHQCRIRLRYRKRLERTPRTLAHGAMEVLGEGLGFKSARRLAVRSIL